jgi:hypothetical protein
MANEIIVGDLVMVVRPTKCCGSPKRLGLIFRVIGFGVFGGPCGVCGKRGDGSPLVMKERYLGYVPQRLIKIDPPAQPESTETRKEIKA